MKQPKHFIVKLSSADPTIPLLSPDELRERSRGFWKTTLPRLNETRSMLVLYRGLVLAAYDIGNMIEVDTDATRVKFTLTEKPSDYVGRVLDYPTSNPFTVADESKLIIK